MKRFLAGLALLTLTPFAAAHAGAPHLYKEQLHFLTSKAATVGVFTDSMSFTSNTANQQDTTAWVDMAALAGPRCGTVTTDSTLWLRLVIQRADGLIGSTQLVFTDDSMYCYIESSTNGTRIGMPAALQAPAVDSGLGTAERTPEAAGVSTWVWSIAWGRVLAAAGGADLRQPKLLRFILRGDSSAANSGEFEGFVEFVTESDAKSGS